MYSLREIGQKLSEEKFSGSVTCADLDVTVKLWFVRGEIVHASSPDGSVGWEALTGAMRLRLEIRSVEPDALPPERSIRVSSSRLLDALGHSEHQHHREEIYVPVPFHARLQNKFSEIQRRISGLRSLETQESAAPHRAETSSRPVDSQLSGDRVIIEVSPRGAQWQHHSHGQELTINADNTVSTSDLMWAGEEMRKELHRLNKELPGNE